MSTNTRPLLVELPFVVKTYDIDFANIVHNAVYIRWLEDLRQQILVERMPMEEMLAQRVSPILTKTEIEYRWPARFGDTITGYMWVASLNRTRWTVGAEIVCEEKVVATATQQGYFADLDTLRPIRVPDKLRRRWEAACSSSS